MDLQQRDVKILKTLTSKDSHHPFLQVEEINNHFYKISTSKYTVRYVIKNHSNAVMIPEWKLVGAIVDLRKYLLENGLNLEAVDQVMSTATRDLQLVK